MSLIHNALKEMDEPADNVAPLAPRSARPDAGADNGLARAALIGVPLVIAAAGATWWWLKPAAPTPSPVPVAAAAPVAPLAAAPAPAPAVESTPAAQPAVHKRHHVRPARKHKPAKPPMPSAETLYAQFLQALNRGDLVAGKALLDQLAIVLPADSLSLKRAQAWYAVKSGDTDTAQKTYRTVLDRAPGDVEASLNLASLDARAGQVDKARAVLADAIRLHPDSAPLQQAIRAMGGSAR